MVDSIQTGLADVRSFRGALEQFAIWIFFLVFLLFFFKLPYFDVASNWSCRPPAVLCCQLDRGWGQGWGCCWCLGCLARKLLFSSFDSSLISLIGIGGRLRVPQELSGLCSDRGGGKKKKKRGMKVFNPSGRVVFAFVSKAWGPFVVFLLVSLDVCLHAGWRRQFSCGPQPLWPIPCSLLLLGNRKWLLPKGKGCGSVGFHTSMVLIIYPPDRKRKPTNTFGHKFCISLFSFDDPIFFFFIAIYPTVSGFKEISCAVTSLIKIIVSPCEKRQECCVCSQLSVLLAGREHDSRVLNRVKSRGLHFNTQLTFK